MEIKSELIDNAMIIKIVGLLDASNYKFCEDTIQSHIQEGTRNMVFNLQDLEYMSSAGVRVFIKTYRSLSAQRGHMAFSCLQPFVREIFEVAGLIPEFQIFLDNEGAIKSFTSSDND
ncbi:MAG TPA: STAS domain-containing protein [Methanospirillum sp.]|nr:STAS domain-containing protein [Methanospirillum sp.]